MKKLGAIAVFCGSSEGNDMDILADTKRLGKKLAQEDITLVYGGSKIGVMGVLAKSVLDNKGQVIGVIPEFLKLKEVVHLGLDELVVTQNMHDRKLKMHEIADGFIALPGGFGTMEELFEIITWSQLGLHQKPIALLNSNNFYDSLISFLENMVSKGFLKISHLDLLIVDKDIDSLIEKMRDFKPKPRPKWLKLERT